MIRKKDLKDYGFATLEEYFEMIVDSKLNGQFSQVHDQFLSLDKKQRKIFIKYLVSQMLSGVGHADKNLDLYHELTNVCIDYLFH